MIKYHTYTTDIKTLEDYLNAEAEKNHLFVSAQVIPHSSSVLVITGEKVAEEDDVDKAMKAKQRLLENFAIQGKIPN